jgi:hypothetical protein
MLGFKFEGLNLEREKRKVDVKNDVGIQVRRLEPQTRKVRRCNAKDR